MKDRGRMGYWLATVLIILGMSCTGCLRNEEGDLDTELKSSPEHSEAKEEDDSEEIQVSTSEAVTEEENDTETEIEPGTRTETGVPEESEASAESETQAEGEDDKEFLAFGMQVTKEMNAQAVLLMNQMDEWYAEYNGDKIQIADTVTFYRADEDESVEEVLKCMVDAWYADLPKQMHGALITDYFLDEDQLIYDIKAVRTLATEFAWDWWLDYRDSYEGEVDEFIAQVMARDISLTRPIAPGMWLIPYLDIYTRYEEGGFISWDSYVAQAGDQMKNGCMPVIREGTGSGSHYILIKRDNVYRLQTADDMNYRWGYYGSFWDEEARGLEFEYELTSGDGTYYIDVQDFGEGKFIEKKGDTYIVIGSGKTYSGQVVITKEQKQLLDGGAVMKIMRDGQELDRIRMVLTEKYSYRDKKMIRAMAYRGEKNGGGFFAIVQSPEDNERMRSVAGIDLSAAPYNGKGYYLRPFEEFPASFYGFRWSDGEVRLELSGDIPVEMHGWSGSVAEFYENKVIIGFGLRFLVYEENGEVVKLFGRATP